MAYWSFDDTKNEKISGIAPTSSANDALVPNGVRGKALSLNAGWIYYGSQFANFKTEALKSFTVSAWVQVLNNGSKKTLPFTISRPGIYQGNVNLVLETNSKPATDLDNLIVKAVYTDLNGNTQDNLNAPWLSSYKSPKLGADKWTHLVITYDAAANNIQIWADGVKIGTTDYQNRGTNYFKSWEQNEVIIGSNYNSIPGKEVNANTEFAPMTGKIDEIRVYNAVVDDAHIKTLFNLGVANK
ncbi:hypothetical protein D3C78_1276330 [compost metagenome]